MSIRETTYVDKNVKIYELEEQIKILNKGIIHEQKLRRICERQLAIAIRGLNQVIGESSDKYIMNIARDSRAKIEDLGS
jgi:DNA-directed RNA polymerase subunit H (RpoH/RPB5)